MPKPLPYTTRDGRTTWRVRYRDLARRSCSQTFERRTDADWFCRTIETHGIRVALRALDDMETEARPDDSPIVRDVFEEFITWKGDYLRSPRTVGDYRRQYKDTIAPTFEATPIAEIGPDDIGAWVDRMVSGKITSPRTGKKLSPKTIAGRHALMHSIMEYAAHPRRGYIAANPCAGITLPKRIKPTPKGLMPAEWQAIYAALRTIDQDAADMAAFLVGSGWRWGEAAALTPAAVEDYGTSLYVTMMQVKRRGETSAYSIAEDEGKQQKSMRRIKLAPEDADIIRRRIVGLAPNAEVFTGIDRKNGERVPWSYNMLRKRWNRAVEAANISRKPSIHWLRHTHVAWLAMTGTPLPELQARIGHASITTTIGTYGSMIGDVSEDALDAFAALRDGKRDGPRLPPVSD